MLCCAFAFLFCFSLLLSRLIYLGEMYFSDVYATQRVPDSLRQNEILWGECLSGALYWNDFIRLSKMCGFTDPRLVILNLCVCVCGCVRACMCVPVAVLMANRNFINLSFHIFQPYLKWSLTYARIFIQGD